MGCDIHAVIEYERDGNYCSFANGTLRIPRDYALFRALAGVRADPGEEPLFHPRGLPSQWSHVIRMVFFLRVLEDGEERIEGLRGLSFVQRAEAEECVKRGRSFYVADATGRPRAFVSDPDYHTPSWLTLDEILAALAYHKLKVRDQSPAFQAMLAAMAELSKQYGPEKARLVFWFDG